MSFIVLDQLLFRVHFKMKYVALKETVQAKMKIPSSLKVP